MNGIYAGTVPTPTLISLTGEPVSLEEQKLFSRIDQNVEDTLVSSLVSAARQWFEIACDRQFMTASWQMKIPGFFAACWSRMTGRLGAYEFGVFGTGGRIDLPYPPLHSVTSITYLDTSNVLQTLSPTLYNVVTSTTPGAVEPIWTTIWPTTYLHPEAVTITFQAGYGTATQVPELVKSGIKLLADHWYKRGDTTDIPPAVKAIACAGGAYRF